jgi:uncharacterized protein (DUF927 family)
MDATEFLKTIFEYAETGYTYLFTLPNQRSYSLPVTDLDGIPAIIGANMQQNIYFSPGISNKNSDARCGIDDIVGITALWVDIDIFDAAAHAKDNLPRSVEEAMAILPDLSPSIILHSGFGLHCWWILKEAWYFDTPEEKQQAQQLLTNLQLYIRQRAAEHGWHLDNTSNLDRVMRVPGTLNHKHQQPVWAQVIEHSEARYNPSDIQEVIPERIDSATAKPRQSAFERRPTDGPAAYMLQNCIFMQHVQMDAKAVSYGEWLAALTNIVRATDGIQAAHAVSAMDPNRYKQKDCDKKIDECLLQMNPQNCQYIQQQLGFRGCPPGGCGMAAPCGWSLGTLPQARALVRSITVPSPETVYQPQVLGALAILEKEAPAEYDVFFQKLSGLVNKNTFRKELAKHKREKSGFTVIDGGGQPSQPPGDGRWLSQAVPDVPLNLKLPESGSNYSSWVFNQSGIKLRKVTDRGESYSEAAYAPVVISERIYNIDSGKEKARVEFKTHRGKWRSVVLPKSTIFDAKQIMCLADSGLTLNSEMAKTLTKWLSALEAANAQIIPERDGVAKLGWRNHEAEFILPGIDTKYTLDVGDPASETVVAGFGIAGEFTIWMDAMRRLRTRNKARFIMAAAFAAPLLKIVGQRTFLVHNWGDTADGKTAALYAALSAWGDPEQLKQTFNQTSTFVERSAELFTDLPLGINEYEVLTERKKGEVDPIIYMIGEGKGRGRARKEGLQKTAQWRTIAIMNGEQPIIRNNSRGGVITRVLEIQGGPLADDKNFASDLYRITARHHGHAGKLYIEHLLQFDHEELRDIYHKTRYALREKYPDKIEAHLDAIACIALADFLVSMWIFNQDKESAGRDAITMADGILAELIARTEADEAERAWAWLQDWIASNENRFMKQFRDHKSGIPVVGYVENEFIYIIKTELSNAMKSEGYSPEKTFRSWADQDRIPCSSLGEKRTFGVRGRSINGVRPYVIPVKIVDDGTLFNGEG